MTVPASFRGFLLRLVPGDARHLARGTWALDAVCSARIELPSGVAAPRAAREAVDSHLGPLLDEQEAADLRLLVTEGRVGSGEEEERDQRLDSRRRDGP